MNNNVKRLLAATLALSMLTGCGSTKQQTPTMNNGSYSDVFTPAGDANAGAGQVESVKDVVSNMFDGFMSSTESAVMTPPMGVYDEGIYMPQDEFNTTEIKDVEETGFSSVLVNPLSTFSADVDTASYTLLRQSINYDMLPTSVRIEEMLNYFDWDIEHSGEDPFYIHSEIFDNPWNKDTKLMLLVAKGKELSEDKEIKNNIVLLIDISGSMDEEMNSVKETALKMCEQFDEDDRISIVTYAGNTSILANGLTGSDIAEIKVALQGLSAGGSTNGGAALDIAYDLAMKYHGDDTNSRIIVMSDGDFNVGLTTEASLVDLIKEKRDQGVYLSILGYGYGNVSDSNLESMADHGNGNYSFVLDKQEMNKICRELTSMFVTLGADFKFQVEFNPEQVKGYRLIGYENRRLSEEDFEDDTVDAGEVGYGHQVAVLYEIVPADSEFEVGGNSELKYQNSEVTTTGSTDWCTVSYRFKDKIGEESQLFESVVKQDSYTGESSVRAKFAAMVGAFGQIVNDGQFLNGFDISDVKTGLRSIENDVFIDDYKETFIDVVKAYSKLM